MSQTPPIAFGDRVRVRSVPATEELGVASLLGDVYGETTPSVTGVDVVGELSSDYAVNVHFEDRQESLWFPPELLEFVDHGAGTEIRLEGVPKRWVRTEEGGWLEEDDPSQAGPSRRRRWWRRR